jgi:hypothetical protein
VIARTSACTACGVAFALNVTTNGAVPVPPLKLPIAVPANVTVDPAWTTARLEHRVSSQDSRRRSSTLQALNAQINPIIRVGPP